MSEREYHTIEVRTHMKSGVRLWHVRDYHGRTVGVLGWDRGLPFGEPWSATARPWQAHPKTRFFKTMKGAVNWIVREDMAIHK